jgi:hypothetical protein
MASFGFCDLAHRGAICRRSSVPIPLVTIALFAGVGLALESDHGRTGCCSALGKHLGMFVQRTQNTNVHYIISDKPMTDDEWKKRYVTPH